MSKTQMLTCAAEKEKAVYILRMEKEIPQTAFQKGILAFALSQPLKNCHSEQQIEVISVIVPEVTVTELTKGLLILV